MTATRVELACGHERLLAAAELDACPRRAWCWDCRALTPRT